MQPISTPPTHPEAEEADGPPETPKKVLAELQMPEKVLCWDCDAD